MTAGNERHLHVSARNYCRQAQISSPEVLHAFYLDGVSFVHKTRPLSDALAPRGWVWRKRSEGLQVTTKGSKSVAGGKRLHPIVAISYKQGVVMVKEYEKMTGEYFAWFVRNKFRVLFSRKRGRKWFIMDNDPSELLKATVPTLFNK